MATEWCSTADVLARLRMDEDHPDAPYVDLCRQAACELIDNHLALADGTLDPGLVGTPPAAAHRAGIGVSIRIYRFKDAESDVSDQWSSGFMPLRIPRDPLAGYVELLGPSKHSWSLA